MYFVLSFCSIILSSTSFRTFSTPAVLTHYFCQQFQFIFSPNEFLSTVLIVVYWKSDNVMANFFRYLIEFLCSAFLLYIKQSALQFSNNIVKLEGYEIVLALIMKIMVILDVMHCSLEERYQCFVGTCGHLLCILVPVFK
jgi:hypothetical protein